MQSIKIITDEVSFIGKPMDPGDIIDCVLKGSITSYNIFVEQINQRDPSITFDDLHKTDHKKN